MDLTGASTQQARAGTALPASGMLRAERPMG